MASTNYSRPAGLFSLLLIFLATLTNFVAAQTVLDSSKLPSCYSQCQSLTQANTGCVPPSAPVSNQGTYQGCFCSSQLLTTLYSTPSGLTNCNACSATDLQQIQSWYLSLCHGGVVVTPAAGATTATATASSTTASGAATTTGTAASQTSGSSSAANTSTQPKPWFSTHWKWVVLLIVLFLAFVFFLVGGFWLKRRRRARRAAKRYSGTGQLRTATSPSPFASGILAPSDGAYIGSRNHPPMSAVGGAGSTAAMERYGSGSHLAYAGYGSDRDSRYEVPSPPPASAGNARQLPWMSRNNSGGSYGRPGSNRMSAVGLHEQSVSRPVSPIEGEEEAAAEEQRPAAGKKLARRSRSRRREES